MTTRPLVTSPLVDTIRAVQQSDEILGEILAADLYEHEMAKEALPPSVLIDAPEAAHLMGILLMCFQQRVQRGRIPRHAIVRTGRRVQFVRARLPGMSSK